MAWQLCETVFIVLYPALLSCRLTMLVKGKDPSEKAGLYIASNWRREPICLFVPIPRGQQG